MQPLKTLLTGLLSTALVSTAIGADLKPAEQIETRQAGYTFMSWNMKKIKANLDGDYNQPAVQAAANAIAGIANSGMGALYGPGTDQDIGDVKTRVKPELFTEREEVGRVARDFIEAANSLVDVAALGEPDDVKAAFGDLGKSCKACHDQFRKEKE
jgi:cytochrome c556